MRYVMAVLLGERGPLTQQEWKTLAEDLDSGQGDELLELVNEHVFSFAPEFFIDTKDDKIGIDG